MLLPCPDLTNLHRIMSITVCSTSKEKKDPSLGSESMEASSTEKRTSPHKDGIHSFLHRAQKTVENGFLRCRCCCQDSVEGFVPQPKPHYEGLESPEAQSEDTTPDTDVTCISERTQSLSVQSSSNSSVFPGEVPVETTGASDSQSLHNITTLDITSIAEDNVEKKSSTSATDKHISWKKTRSFFRRARKAVKLPLLCSGVDAVKPFGPPTDSTQTLNLEEPSDGMLSSSESIMES